MRSHARLNVGVDYNRTWRIVAGKSRRAASIWRVTTIVGIGATREVICLRLSGLLVLYPVAAHCDGCFAYRFASGLFRRVSKILFVRGIKIKVVWLSARHRCPRRFTAGTVLAK